jgi:multiple sugar transport system substrate-binding protein
MAQWNPVIPTWADNKLLTPYEDLMSPEEKARFYRDAYPSVQRLGVYKGKLYGITTGMNVNAVFYRPQDWREVGLDPDKFPDTLEELVEIGHKLDKFDAKGNLTRLGFLTQSWRAYVPLFGGGFYDWKSQKLSIESPANLRCLEFLASERKKLGFEQVTRFQSGLDTLSMKAGWPFVPGSYSMVLDGQWRVEELRKYSPDLEYRVAPLPPPKGGVAGAGTTGGNFMIVPRSGQNKKGAWDFIRWWSGLKDPIVAAKNYVKGGWLPLMPSIAQAPDYQKFLRENPTFKVFVDQMPSQYLQVNPPVAYQTFVTDRIGKYEDSTFRGTTSPQQAIKKLDNDIKVELERRRQLGYDE